MDVDGAQEARGRVDLHEWKAREEVQEVEKPWESEELEMQEKSLAAHEWTNPQERSCVFQSQQSGRSWVPLRVPFKLVERIARRN